MKKFAALLALLIAALALVACGGGSSTTSEGTSPAGGAVEEAEETVEEAGEEVEEKAEEAKKEVEGGGSAALEFEADPGGALAFTSDTATAKAGKVTVDFKNESGVPHDVAIESEGGETVGQTEIIPEGSDSTTVTLKPGTYHYYCTVPGHRQAGMEGTLTVK